MSMAAVNRGEMKMANKPNTKKVSSHDHKLSDKTLAKIHSPLGPVAEAYSKEEENFRISAEPGEEKNEIKRLEARGKEKRLADKKIAWDCLTRASKRMVVDNPGGTVTVKTPSGRHNNGPIPYCSRTTQLCHWLGWGTITVTTLSRPLAGW